MDNTVKGAIISGVVSIIVAIIGVHEFILPGNQPPVISNLIQSPHGPHVEGTLITWTAIASNPNKDALFYKFLLNGPSTGNRYVVQQDWSQKSAWIWNSGHSDIGTNSIQVLVKDAEQESSPYFGNYSITKNWFGEIIHTNYTKMDISETYPFMACVALNDSIDNAKREIMIFTGASEKSIITSNDSIDNAKRDPGIEKTPMNVSKDMEVDLEQLTPGTFSISLKSPKSGTHKIPQDDPGHNYATWIWDVTPIRVGTHDLILSAYDEEGHNRNARISITVTVNPELQNVAEAKAEEKAEAVHENVTEAAGAAKEAAASAEKAAEKAAPGFEGLFAVTGLLAVAYLVLGRRE